jgi:hypothetical protein
VRIVASFMAAFWGCLIMSGLQFLMVLLGFTGSKIWLSVGFFLVIFVVSFIFSMLALLISIFTEFKNVSLDKINKIMKEDMKVIKVCNPFRIIFFFMKKLIPKPL